MLYFIDTNCDIIQYNLNELLSLDGTLNQNYVQKPKTVGPFEDLCVAPRDSTKPHHSTDNPLIVTTLTKTGVLSQTHNPAKQNDLKTHKSGELGTQFGTIETLGGYYVVASYDPTKSAKAYSVFADRLDCLASLAVPCDKAMVQNMLLFERQRTLHILSANEGYYVDLLVFNGDKVHLIETHTVNSTHIWGIVWKTQNREALVCDATGTLKSIKFD